MSTMQQGEQPTDSAQVETQKRVVTARHRDGRMSRALERVALPIAWLAVIIFFSVLPATSSTFPTSANVSSILGSQVVLVVLALGLIVPLTTGDYDLSVAFTMMLSAMIVAVLNVEHGWAIGPAIAAALAAGAVVGFVNGAFVILFGIDPLIVTLGTGTFMGGLVLWISNSNTITGVSSALVNPVITDSFLGIPLGFYYGIILCAVLWYVLDYTPLGRRLLIVGRNREVARLSGFAVSRVRWGALVTSGFIAALAGVFYAGITGAADPTSGASFLLPAFAAAFLGATTISPGRFNAWGTVIAVYFLVTGISGLQLLGVESFVQNMFYGAALVIAVTLSQLVRRRRVAAGGSS